MALYPAAVKKLLPENKIQTKITPTQIILHSAVDGPGDTYLFGYFGRDDVTLESHFFVKNNGQVEQYMDTGVRADANYQANDRAISIETEDDGDPNNKPWTAAQLLSLVMLCDWLCDTHQIPRVPCPSPFAPGIGWHAMWGAPSVWTPVRGKTCPGTARVPQVQGIIDRVAAMGGGPSTKGPFMALSDDQQRQLADNVIGTRLLLQAMYDQLNPNGPTLTEVGIRGGAAKHVADIWRWGRETVLDTRQIRQEVAAAVAEAIAGDGPVDPDAVADAVIAKIKEKL